MKRVSQHLVRCLVAGIVAILPIGGLIILISYVETTLASSGLGEQWFYFPSLGILAAALFVYFVGLTVTTFVGRWIWKRVDRLLNSLPLLGNLYLSLKQILGYGEGADAIFTGTVLVPDPQKEGREIGLITNEITLADGSKNLVVFIPSSPNPTSGRLIIADPNSVERISMPVSEALKTLVAVGKGEFGFEAAPDTLTTSKNRNGESSAPFQ